MKQINLFKISATTSIVLCLNTTITYAEPIASQGKNDSVISTGTKSVANSSFNYSMTCGLEGKEACKVGTMGPGGGWIFFVDYYDQYPDFDYLEAAPEDIGPVAWCNDTSHSIAAVNGWFANAIGIGQANTRAMLGACTSGAAYEADHYTKYNKSDWFLGSEGEMMLMYTNLRETGVGDFTDKYYWSSTEGDVHYAWHVYFVDGSQYGSNKFDSLLVRPIRAFK